MNDTMRASRGAQFPVFVVAPPRSGTTLVYSILLSSGAFPIYEAESRIVECRPRYGRLSNRRNFRRFVHDYRRSRQFARSGLDPDRFLPEAMERCESYLDFLRFFMESMASQQGKLRWVEKTPNHILNIDELSRAFPDARFIHVIRDGRAVALSQRSVGHTDQFHRDPLIRLVWAAKMWELLAGAGRASGHALGERYLELRYEDVVSRLDQTIERLRDFAQIDLDRDQIAQTRVGALAQANTAFTDDGMQGVSEKAKERWKERLTDRELEVLEWSIGKSLRRFGYELSGVSAPRIGPTVRLHSGLAPVALLAKRYLNRYTPVGRFSLKPLEIGLT